MGEGPEGSGVVIRKPDPDAPRETYQQREARERMAHAKNVREHEARQVEFEAQQKQDQQRHEDKMLRRTHETKSARPPRESPEDLAALSDTALVALAETRALVVTNADGHEPTRDDYIRALSA